MGRLLSIDYGRKRVGIAVTDELQLIANQLTTVHSKDIFTFLEDYLTSEKVDKIIIGEPKQMDNSPSEAEKFIAPFITKLKKLFPDMIIERVDERFTSKIAFQTMIDSGKPTGCGEGEGSYTWFLKDKVLVMSLEDDNCVQRKSETNEWEYVLIE